jgi:hypothetical protein
LKQDNADRRPHSGKRELQAALNGMRERLHSSEKTAAKLQSEKDALLVKVHILQAKV